MLNNIFPKHVGSGALGLILLTLLVVQPVTPQSNRIEAKMVEKENGSLKKTNVLLSYNDSEFNIKGKGRNPTTNTIPFSEIKHANYTYSDRIQIAEGIGAAAFMILSSGYLVPGLMVGAMFLTTRKKAHWLGIQAADRSLVFELKKDDYRQILLDLKTRGINIEDLGRSEPVKK